MKRISKIFIVIAFVALVFALSVECRANPKALGVRAITHNDTLNFIDKSGVERSVNYTLKFNLCSDQNGRYTSHQFKSISFDNNEYATFQFYSLNLTSTNTSQTLANLKLTVLCTMKGDLLSDRKATDSFSYSTYGPYSLK